MEGLLSSMELGFGLILRKLSAVLILLLPDGLCQFMFQSLHGDTVLSLPVLTLLVGVLFIFRLIQSVKSQLTGRHEKQLAKTLAAKIEQKCHLIDKIYMAKKECAKMETTVKKARLPEKEPVNIPSLANAYTKLMMVNLNLRKEIDFLIQELKQERCLQSIREEMVEMLKVLKSLEEVTRISTSQGAFTNQPGDRAPSPDGPFPRSGSSY